jgi:hypothetical protein
MSSLDREAPSQPETETVALPDEHDRELLDYLIERAWQEFLRRLPQVPANENRKMERKDKP